MKAPDLARAAKPSAAHVVSPKDHGRSPAIRNPLLERQQAIGNQAVQRLLSAGVIQAKLTVGKPGDVFEQEADRVAERVMRIPEPDVAERVSIAGQSNRPRIQRACSECEKDLRGKPLEEEEELKELLQTKETPGRIPEITEDMELRINTLRDAGQPLPESTRAFFEPRFGRDFSGVRIHIGPDAADSARALSARAYTLGSDIVFGTGEYAPGTLTGQRLLAHELTHVEQQAEGVSSSISDGAAPVASADGPLVQRVAIFDSGGVVANRDAAWMSLVTGHMGETFDFLNGVMIRNEADARAAIRAPILGNRSTDDGYECWVEDPPVNVASTLEFVLNPGPWVATAPKLQLAQTFPTLGDCADEEGTALLYVRGVPSDPAIAEVNRLHEDIHAVNYKLAFYSTIALWDQLLTSAEGKVFPGPSQEACASAALYESVGGTPDAVASRLSTMTDGMDLNFHAGPIGGPIRLSGAKADWGCDEVTVDAHV